MEYQDVFWIYWLDNEPVLRQSIVKLAIAKNYQGDPSDVVSDVMLVANDRWREYNKRAAGFRTWVIWIAREYLTSLYRSNPLPVSLFTPVGEDGDECLLDFIEGENGRDIVDKLAIREEIKDIFVLYRESKFGRVLEAMAALVDANIDVTTRNLAKILGVSHTTIAKDLRELREELSLQNLDNLL